VQLGESYIEKAIRYAKEADPNVLLFYNDYNLEFNALKRSAVLAHFGKLRTKGITIDGIGVQMHIFHIYPSPLMIRECLNEIANEKYKIHISEMDVSVNPLSVDVEYTDSVQTLQMQQYETVLNAYEQIPAELQYGCTFWGITDKYTWIRSSFLREDYPLLFDDNYKKKKLFNAVKFALCK
jgi:endo-1,4-beta-xylanase